MPNPTKYTPRHAARFFGCSIKQARAGYAQNEKGLRQMLEKAREIEPKKYRGYTVAQLEEMVQRAEYNATPQAQDILWDAMHLLTGLDCFMEESLSCIMVNHTDGNSYAFGSEGADCFTYSRVDGEDIISRTCDLPKDATAEELAAWILLTLSAI